MVSEMYHQNISLLDFFHDDILCKSPEGINLRIPLHYDPVNPQSFVQHSNFTMFSRY